jgi:chemotaxis protein CheZ
MSGYLATRDANEADYEAIADAVMETERGRWFLREFARRNRHADTEMLLTSLGRIERAVDAHREPPELARFRVDVLEMSRAIARMRSEIAAIKPADGDGHLVEASGELESIVSATERATSEILATAEQIQEVAWTLREGGAAPQSCDQLDQQAVAIYTACSFQDLTAQRTRKVTEILSFLERRVNAMADIWQEMEQPASAAKRRTGDAAARPAAFAGDDPVMSQADVDDVLVQVPVEPLDFEIEIEGAPAAKPIGQEEGPVAFADPSDVEVAVISDIAIDDAGLAPTVEDILFEAPAQLPPAEPAATPALRLVASDPAAADGIAKAKAGSALTGDEASAALDALAAMSVEERTKLFS